jgi:hypothetical protein
MRLHPLLRRILTVTLLLVATLVTYGVDARINPAHAVAAEPQSDWSKATQVELTPDEIVLAKGAVKIVADGTETGWQRVDTWTSLATCEYEAEKG